MADRCLDGDGEAERDFELMWSCNDLRRSSGHRSPVLRGPREAV